MANTKISALTAATTPVAGTEVLPIVQSSTTKQVSIANLTAGRSVSATDYVMTTGNLVPSTAAKGINFTANTSAAGMTSQLFNYYEEGTWTPSDSSGAGLSFTQNTTAVYVKAGKLVHCNFDITFPVTLSASFVSISLPFAAQASTAVGGGVGYQTYGAWIGIYGTGSAINLYIASGSALQNVNMTAKRIQACIVYRSST
jgi:hypothetical protein